MLYCTHAVPLFCILLVVCLQFGCVVNFMGFPQSTYICRVQSCVCVFQNIDPPPPPPLRPASVSSPRTKGGGTHSPGGEGGGGSIFCKKPDIGLASYTIISLRGYLWAFPPPGQGVQAENACSLAEPPLHHH